MASPNDAKLHQQNITIGHRTPPSTPPKGTVSNTKTTQEQGQKQADVVGSASAMRFSSNEPRSPERGVQSKDTTRPSSPAKTESSTGDEDRSSNTDNSIGLPEPYAAPFDNHLNEECVPASLDDSFKPFNVQNHPGEGCEPDASSENDLDSEGDLYTSQYYGGDANCPSHKGEQKEVIHKESVESFKSAMEVIPNGTAEAPEDLESRPGDTANDAINAPLPDEEFRDAWHNCDSCGNIIRCTFGKPEIQNDDAEVDDGTEAQVQAPEGQTMARGLIVYLARLIAPLGPRFTRLFPRAGSEAISKMWNGPAGYDARIVPPGQGWNTAWNEAGDVVKTPADIIEEEPLYLLVKYDSRPFPDPSGAKNTGERGAKCTIVSDILPSAPYPTLMSTILHRLKGTDGTHNPYPIAPTAQIDYVDVQFGAIAAHAPGFLGRQTIDRDNVGDVLKYLQQRTGGDDVLEVFLVPMNEQEEQERAPMTFKDWMFERATSGKTEHVIGGEVLHDRLAKTYQEWVAETGFVDKDEEMPLV